MITNIDYLSQLSIYNKMGLTNRFDNHEHPRQHNNNILNFELNKQPDRLNFNELYKTAKQSNKTNDDKNLNEKQKINGEKNNDEATHVMKNSIYQATKKLSRLFEKLGFSKEESELFSKAVTQSIQNDKNKKGSTYDFSLSSAKSFNYQTSDTQKLSSQIYNSHNKTHIIVEEHYQVSGMTINSLNIKINTDTGELEITKESYKEINIQASIQIETTAFNKQDKLFDALMDILEQNIEKEKHEQKDNENKEPKILSNEEIYAKLKELIEQETVKLKNIKDKIFNLKSMSKDEIDFQEFINIEIDIISPKIKEVQENSPQKGELIEKETDEDDLKKIDSTDNNTNEKSKI